MYDYLIVGSGLFGATFAHQAKLAGKSCLVIDKRPVPGGNVACEDMHGINVHSHGPHIFHTNDEAIWKYVNSFVPFNGYVHQAMACHGLRLYNLPFNLNTFYQLWGCTTPKEAQKHIFRTGGGVSEFKPGNLKEHAILQVGTEVFELFIRHYTEKQWGRKCEDLPASIIKRIPVRFTFDNRYFSDRFQGIPVGGYNPLIAGMLKGIDIILKADYFNCPAEFNALARKIVYTGPIDQFFSYQFGPLEYRSLRFEHDVIHRENVQGCAIINYTGPEVPYTRIVEHKHFQLQGAALPVSVITREYPEPWAPGKEPYYPINDELNNARYKQYAELAKQDDRLIIGGRLGKYKYYNMDQVIASALKAARLEFGQ